jgi:elongation of very long chain fatty acids protein 6
MILSKEYEQTICTSPFTSWGLGTTGFWVMLFIFSKIPELVDTLFIVLRKKPLIFLHWYHHVTVLLFCWNAYATGAGSGLYFVAMNFTVHALMYGYYCLQSLGLCPKSFPAVIITISQIAQMLVGTAVCISAWYFTLRDGASCHNDMSNLVAGGLMYGSYLYLFVEFAIRRYIQAPKRKSGRLVAKTL